jgi:hypothetical protein
LRKLRPSLTREQIMTFNVNNPILNVCLTLVFHAWMPVAASEMSMPDISYKSILEAVTAASDRYNPESITTDTEHFGIILKAVSKSADQGAPVDSYRYTHATAKKRQDSFRLKVKIPAGYQLAAVWHTHGRRNPAHRFFSPTDVRTANRLQVPVYLADYTGILKVYSPDDHGSSNSPGLGRNSVALLKRPARGTVIRDNQGDLVTVRVREGDNP